MSNTKSPFVSVLMPAYNVEPYIKKAIQSILDQTYTDFELIITDDCSTDQTLSIIHSFNDSRICCIANPHNLGYADNMNSLFNRAKGKYLVIQDADDYCTENRLQVLVDFLNTHESIAMVGSSYFKIDEQGGKEIILKSEDTTEIETAFIQMVDPLPVLNGSVMFQRKIIDEGFLFRNLQYVNRSQDDDWLFRISENFRIANVKDCLYYYRFNPRSMTMNLSSINYYSLFSGEYVRFLKQVRTSHGKDLLAEGEHEAIEVFFRQKKKELTNQQPAFLELYIAHKQLAFGQRLKAMSWFFKALYKNPSSIFIWKKIIFLLLRRDN